MSKARGTAKDRQKDSHKQRGRYTDAQTNRQDFISLMAND